MNGKVVLFIPAANDEALQAVIKKLDRDSLSAKVIRENEDGTVNLTVNVPGSQNVLRVNVGDEPNKKGEYFQLLPTKESIKAEAAEKE